MAALARLTSRFGPEAGSILAFAGLAPSAPLSVLAALPDAFFVWAIRTAGVPAADVPGARDWLRALTLEYLSQGPVPAGAVAAPAPYRFQPPSWAACHPRPAPHHSWIELIASGTVISAQAVAYALETIFRESQALQRYNEASGGTNRLSTFAERATASGCRH